MKISFLKEHHPEIYKRVLEECNVKISKSDEIDVLFRWATSKEKWLVWNSVSNGYFKPFYDFHKLPNPENKEVKGEFYNTTNIKGEELKVSKEKAIKQDVLIYNQLPQNTEFSAWTIFNNSKLPLNTPITSVRRALNSLEAQGKIEKFGKRKGALGKTENTYKLIL